MFKYGLIFVVFLSLNSYAGKIEDAQIAAIMAQTDANMRDRLPLYKEAFQVLSRHRLLPYSTVGNWKPDILPCGPIYEKNIFHFFWARPLINVEMLGGLSMGGTDYIEFHLHTCCSDRMHGVNQHRTANPLSDFMKKELEMIYGILGTSQELFFKELPAEKKAKIPDYAEVLFLDYMIAREEMLRYNCHHCEKKIRPLADALSWTYFEPVTKRNIGRSLAYKLSSPETFTKFGLVPLMKYLPYALPPKGKHSIYANPRGKEAIITENYSWL